MLTSVTLGAARESAARIGRLLHRTPLVRSAYLSERTGAQVWLKLENLQKTGSFKPRGALVTMLGLGRAERERGVVTISAGNHAQGVAYAGRVLGIPTTVVMPALASRIKAEAARGYGAEVVLHGTLAEAFEKLEEIRSERRLALVHPFDSPGAIVGQATLGLEIMEDLPDVDVVVAGVGGGGLLAGTALAATALRPGVRVYGVEPRGADSLHRSRSAGHAVRLERTDTIADGLAAPFTGELCFELARRTVEDVVLVDDREIVEGMRVLFERVKTVAEPAGAAATGALLAGKVPLPKGSKVVAVVSGGNVSAADLARLLAA